MRRPISAGDNAHEKTTGTARRTLLKLGASSILAAAASSWTTRGAAGRGTERFRNAMSVSPFAEHALTQTTFRDGVASARGVVELQRLFNRHGATEIYTRIATRRSTASQDADAGFARGLQRAALAARLGMPCNPELMLDAIYGDTFTYQEPPDFTDYPGILPRKLGPWTSLTLDQMASLVEKYAAAIARQILRTGAQVNYWDLGNEVDHGVAGITPQPFVSPDGAPRYSAPDAVDPEIGKMSTLLLSQMPQADQIAWCRKHLWPYTARLLAAAREGVRQVQPAARFSTHTALLPSADYAIAYWSCMRDSGYLPDVIGTSYYPNFSYTSMDLPVFQDVFTKVSRVFDRKIFIAEFAFSYSPSPTFPVPSPPYLETEADQARFTADLARWGVESGVLQGIRWWAPDYVTNPQWVSGSLFRRPANGISTAVPAIDAIRSVTASSR